MTKHDIKLRVDAGELAAAVKARREVTEKARDLEKSLVRHGFTHHVDVTPEAITVAANLPPLPAPRPVVEDDKAPAEVPEAAEVSKDEAPAVFVTRRPRVGPDLTPPETPPGKRWTQAEHDRLIALVEADCAHDEIVTALGRTSKQVTNKKQVLMRKGVLGGDLPPRPATPQRPELGRAARAIDAHLDALGYKRPWSPVRDHRLAQMLCSGHPLGVVADALEQPRDSIAARYQALNQAPWDLDHQKLLLERLKARAEGK